MSDAAEEAAREASHENDKQLEVDLHEDRTREFKSPSFTRMQTDWSGPNGDTVRGLIDSVENRMLTLFAEAYVVMNELYDYVREPEADEFGVILKDKHGWNIWRKNVHGVPVEDWRRLGIRDRENFMYKISAGLWEWEQIAANLWGESMFSKAVFEEAFAFGFENATGPGRNTVDAKNNAGRLAARQERFFGIYMSLLSRKADALVSVMKLLSQRLKDTVV